MLLNILVVDALGFDKHLQSQPNPKESIFVEREAWVPVPKIHCHDLKPKIPTL